MRGAPCSSAGSCDLKSRVGWNWGTLVRMLSAAVRVERLCCPEPSSGAQAPSLALLPLRLGFAACSFAVVWSQGGCPFLGRRQMRYPAVEAGIASRVFHCPGRETLPRGLWRPPPMFSWSGVITAHSLTSRCKAELVAVLRVVKRSATGRRMAHRPGVVPQAARGQRARVGPEPGALRERGHVRCTLFLVALLDELLWFYEFSEETVAQGWIKLGTRILEPNACFISVSCPWKCACLNGSFCLSFLICGIE